MWLNYFSEYNLMTGVMIGPIALGAVKFLLISLIALFMSGQWGLRQPDLETTLPVWLCFISILASPQLKVTERVIRINYEREIVVSNNCDCYPCDWVMEIRRQGGEKVQSHAWLITDQDPHDLDSWLVVPALWPRLGVAVCVSCSMRAPGRCTVFTTWCWLSQSARWLPGPPPPSSYLGGSPSLTSPSHCRVCW